MAEPAEKVSAVAPAATLPLPTQSSRFVQKMTKAGVRAKSEESIDTRTCRAGDSRTETSGLAPAVTRFVQPAPAGTSTARTWASAQLTEAVTAWSATTSLASAVSETAPRVTTTDGPSIGVSETATVALPSPAGRAREYASATRRTSAGTSPRTSTFGQARRRTR